MFCVSGAPWSPYGKVEFQAAVASPRPSSNPWKLSVLESLFLLPFLWSLRLRGSGCTCALCNSNCTVKPSLLGIGDQEALCVVKGENDSDTVSSPAQYFQYATFVFATEHIHLFPVHAAERSTMSSFPFPMADQLAPGNKLGDPGCPTPLLILRDVFLSVKSGTRQ